ncbi:MAG: hypothetical protein ABIA97_02065 [Candidatus Omnitrophota bacterium]
MEILLNLLEYLNKDLLIFFLLFILILCILRIRKLKKELVHEVYLRLHPQIQLELITESEEIAQGFYIQNDSFFLLKDIKIQEFVAVITDAGFRQELIFKFDQIDFLKAKEKAMVKFEVHDKKGISLPHITEKVIPHLLNILFPVKVYYSTIEGRTFLASLLKKRNKFYIEKIEVLQK